MTSCKKLLAELSNLLDDELDVELRQQLEKHLKACPDCWVVWDTTRKTLQVFRGSNPYALPTDVEERLTAAVKRRLAEKSCRER